MNENDIDVNEENKEEVNQGNWYVIQCYSLQEHKVKMRLDQLMDEELKGKIFRVLLPEEERVEIKNNKRREKVSKMFPGYLFVQMIPDEQVWFEIQQVPGVAKLVGAKNDPDPIPQEEIDKVLRKSGDKSKKVEVDFEVNESIKVVLGPFRGYTGIISEIYADKGKLRSLISIFGRETPVELDFDQVEKIVAK